MSRLGISSGDETDCVWCLIDHLKFEDVKGKGKGVKEKTEEV